mmetsp:Transcript_3398/g.10290  ORF Transcript_3398/g.10290 Transcript_3398/m.10290 type:complete len:283 (+) Transcript_3398:57-905(+)
MWPSPGGGRVRRWTVAEQVPTTLRFTDGRLCLVESQPHGNSYADFFEFLALGSAASAALGAAAGAAATGTAALGAAAFGAAAGSAALGAAVGAAASVFLPFATLTSFLGGATAALGTVPFLASLIAVLASNLTCMAAACSSRVLNFKKQPSLLSARWRSSVNLASFLSASASAFACADSSAAASASCFFDCLATGTSSDVPCRMSLNASWTERTGKAKIVGSPVALPGLEASTGSTEASTAMATPPFKATSTKANWKRDCSRSASAFQMAENSRVFSASAEL